MMIGHSCETHVVVGKAFSGAQFAGTDEPVGTVTERWDGDILVSIPNICEVTRQAEGIIFLKLDRAGVSGQLNVAIEVPTSQGLALFETGIAQIEGRNVTIKIHGSLPFGGTLRIANDHSLQGGDQWKQLH